MVILIVARLRSTFTTFDAIVRQRHESMYDFQYITNEMKNPNGSANGPRAGAVSRRFKVCRARQRFREHTTIYVPTTYVPVRPIIII